MPDQVGDITSDARGSGARFNAGKPQLELIPVQEIVDALDTTDLTYGQLEAVCVLRNLALWQRGEVPAAFALQLMDPDWYVDCANVFAYGAKKYAPWNWAKGMAWSVPLGCILRHAMAIIHKGEINDPESGLPHRGHIACNLVMLATFEKTYPEGDDRPTKWLQNKQAS